MISDLKRNIFSAAGRWSRCATDETIVIAGVPRAGTTWLLELLRALPGRKAINEPLVHESARFDYDFGWHKYIDPDAAAPRQRQFLEQVLTGQSDLIAAWFFEASSQPGKVVEHALRRKLVVKFCRLNRVLHWFTRQFDVQGLVFMVRHPCAVVASMLQQGAWAESRLLNHGPTRREQALHGGTLPESLREPFEPALQRISTHVEVLAVHWCLDHYVPLIHHGQNRKYPWILAPYERLVTGGLAEIERICTSLGVEVTPSMRAKLKEPSSSVVNEVHRDPDQQLAKWQSHLSARQTDQILRVVDAIGLTKYYTEALEPKYAHLNDCQLQQARW